MSFKYLNIRNNVNCLRIDCDYTRKGPTDRTRLVVLQILILQYKMSSTAADVTVQPFGLSTMDITLPTCWISSVVFIIEENFQSVRLLYGTPCELNNSGSL